MAMTQTYRFTDPTTNNQLFECYSTDYIDGLVVTLNNNLTNAVSTINTDIANLNTTLTTNMNTLSTSLTNSINTLNTTLTQYVDTNVNTLYSDIQLVAAEIQALTDGTGSIDVNNVYITNGVLDLANSNITFQSGGNADILNVNHITFMPSTQWAMDMNGGTIVNLGTPINLSDAATKLYVDDAIANISIPVGTYLPIAGGTMGGNIDMNNSSINNIYRLTFRTDNSGAVNPVALRVSSYATVGGVAPANGLFGVNFGSSFYPMNVGPYVMLTGVWTPSTGAAGGTVATVDYVDAKVSGGGSSAPTFTGLTVTGAATFSGTVTISGSPAVTQSTGDIRYLQLSGGTMSGSIDMSSSAISNISTLSGSSAAYGIIMNSPVYMSNRPITALAMQVTPAYTDAANVQYVNNTISGYIPTLWSTTNPLVLVGDLTNAIQSVTSRQLSANATGAPFATAAALTAGPYYYRGATVTPAEHDTAVVLADETATGIYANGQTLHKYDGTTWAYLYGINETPFTPAQNAAINSGITATIVSNIPTGGPFLPLAGGTMAGPLDLNQYELRNVTNIRGYDGIYLSTQGGSDIEVQTGNGAFIIQNNFEAQGVSYFHDTVNLNGNTLVNAYSITNCGSINNGPGTINFNSQTSFNTYPIQNVGNPTYNTDAATKGYVDPRSFTSITVTNIDPGQNSSLATGAITLVYTP